MIRRPPRATRKESSAASDVYKRQATKAAKVNPGKAATLKKVEEGPIPYLSASLIAFRGSIVAVRISLTVVTSIPKIGTTRNNTGNITRGDRRRNQNNIVRIRLTNSSNVSNYFTYLLLPASNQDSNI